MKRRMGGWDFVVAALKMKTSKPGRTKHTEKKKAKRKPDGNIRPSTKFVLITLANHRNHRTGQCNPAYKRLMELTGYSKRTVTFELQALKDLGLVTWKRGWGNDHGKGSNKYSLDLPAIQALEASAVDEESSVEEGAVNAEEGAVDDEEGAVDAEEGAAFGALTSNVEPPILEPPILEPTAGSAAGNALMKGKSDSDAESKGHRQNEAGASDAPSSKNEASASDAPASAPVRRTLSEILDELGKKRAMALYNRTDGKYSQQDAEDELARYRTEKREGVTA